MTQIQGTKIELLVVQGCFTLLDLYMLNIRNKYLHHLIKYKSEAHSILAGFNHFLCEPKVHWPSNIRAVFILYAKNHVVKSTDECVAIAEMAGVQLETLPPCTGVKL